MHLSVRYLRFLVIILLAGFTVITHAQQVNTSDLSQVKVDELTDEQLRNYMQQAAASGMSQQELLQLAASSGMPQVEQEKLAERIQQLQTVDSSVQKSVPSISDRRKEGRSINQTPDRTDTLQRVKSPALTPVNQALPVFGAALFQGSDPKFEPNLRLATPKNYVIGAGDELLLEIYGNSEASYSLTVSPEGAVNIPYVGVVSVAGASIEQATVRIKKRLGSIYKGMNSGQTQVSITLGNIRSIKVIVTGEVIKPGTFTLPAVATVFNALYAAGGPNNQGTLRKINVFRNGILVTTVDVYDFLLHGSLKENIVLQDQDVIQVSPYTNRVEIRGEVKHPATFELKEGETFDQLLSYAGGFTEEAYRTRITVLKTTATERKVEDLLASQFGLYLPQSGDQYRVGKILDRFTNRVRISGAVFRPGVYELSSGLTLSTLIKKADGVKEDAFLNRGYINRLNEQRQREQISFSVSGILAGTANDIALKREDEVIISSISDLRTEYKVQIEGEVRRAGWYDFANGMTLKALIMQAGGFTEGASSTRIEIARRLDAADSLTAGTQTAQIYQVDVDRDFAGADNFLLKPFDVVNVRPATGYERQRSVRIEGEVRYPGRYTLRHKDERVSDLIQRAGGFTNYAYTAGASLKRKDLSQGEVDSTANQFKHQAQVEAEQYQERVARLGSLQKNTRNDLSVVQRATTGSSYVGIDLDHILKNPHGNSDLILEEGDVVRIPKQLQTVRISGEVLSPVAVVYEPGKKFKHYISAAGGFSEQALRKRSYVVYANGSARSTKKVLFFNNYPKVKPGSEIFVPQREPRGRMSAAQWVGIGGSLATTIGVIVALFR